MSTGKVSFFKQQLSCRCSLPPLPSETLVSVTYRSIPNAPQDEEIGINGNINSGGGDSVNITGGTRRQLKPRLILGKAWG